MNFSNNNEKDEEMREMAKMELDELNGRVDPIEEEIKLVPLEGVYAVSLTCGNLNYRGMLNIKNTNESQPSIQVHLFDLEPNHNLIGKLATLIFHKRMRGELILSKSDDLHFQLQKDKNEIEELIY